MSSIDHLIKDKRSIIFEILFSLEGIVGDLVCGQNQINSSELKSISNSSLIQPLSSSQINLINELLNIANNYIKINSFVQEYASGIDH